MAEKRVVGMPKKLTASTVLVYIAGGLLVIVLCVMLGTAMDLSVTEDGTVNSGKLGESFSVVIETPAVIPIALQTKGSYAQKMPVMGAFVIGIFLLYKYSQDKKRLHRRGVEHGSAKWGDQKEMRSLAEKEKKPSFHPLLTSDGKRVFDEKGEFAGVIIDNNILLTKEVFLSLDSRQHLLNLNVLII